MKEKNNLKIKKMILLKEIRINILLSIGNNCKNFEKIKLFKFFIKNKFKINFNYKKWHKIIFLYINIKIFLLFIKKTLD